MSLNCLAQHSLSKTSTCPKFAPFNYNNRHFSFYKSQSDSWYRLIIGQEIRLIKINIISINERENHWYFTYKYTVFLQHKRECEFIFKLYILPANFFFFFFLLLQKNVNYKN